MRPTTSLTKTLPAVLVLAMGLSACAKLQASKFNPINWFGHAQPSGPVALYVAPTDQRVLVAQVLTMKVEKNMNGAILRATGLPPTQGWWKADLVKVDQDDATKLVFEFRLYPPVTPTPAGSQTSREVTVATSLSNIALDGIKTLVVQGKTNALSARR